MLAYYDPQTQQEFEFYPPPVDWDGTPYACIRAADIDEYGNVDVVVAQRGERRLYINDGDGRTYTCSTFTDPAGNLTEIELGDLGNDGDGGIDIIFVDQYGPTRLCLNNNTAGFLCSSIAQCNDARDIVLR